jgi:anti-sigma regulatory factor (Ser/Thr protein kinase)
MDKKISISLINKYDEIPRVAEIIGKFGNSNNIEEKLLNQFFLSIDEVLTNIITYSFKDNNEHIIKLVVKLDSACLSVSIEDDGVAFNPLEQQGINTNLALEEKPIGGLGIHLVKNLTDEQYYERTECKNILTLRKIIK